MAHHLIKNKEPIKEVTKEDGQPDPNPDNHLWEKNDGLLRAWILSNISPKVLISLENVSSASKVWKSIEEFILPTTVERRWC